MRQLLATIILGSALAVTASVAFAGGDRAIMTGSASSSVAVDNPNDSVTLSGAGTPNLRLLYNAPPEPEKR